jgi:hypothetical protein
MALVFPFFFPLVFANESANSESGRGDKRIAKKNVLSLTLIFGRQNHVNSVYLG